MTANAREAHVLLTDWRRKPFNSWLTLHEEQQSWPIDVKATQKITLGTTGHDKMYDRDYVSIMNAAKGKGQPQYKIKDIEPQMLNATAAFSMDGWLYADPISSAFTDKQISMSKDWLAYT